MKESNHLLLLLFISITLISSLSHAQGPELHAGSWQATFGEEMNASLDGQIKMLEAMAKSDSSMKKFKQQMTALLAEARKPQPHSLSEQQAERGVISIFEARNKAAQNSGIEGADCKHEIEWLEKRIGSVSGKCADGSIIKGEVSVTSDIEVHYKATVTPPNETPYPVGWNAKWVGS